VDGRAVVYLDRGGSSMQTLPAFDDAATAELALRALGELVVDGRQRELVIGKIDGEPAGTSKHYDTLLKAGFIQGYRGLVLRRPRAGAMIA
jgi:hypothetical protein